MEQSALKKLKAHLEVEVHPDAIQTISKESLIRGVQGKDYLLCRLGDQMDADVIGANTKLKLIATMAGASAGIDVESATKFRIPVIGRYVDPKRPGSGVTEETADLTWALLMAVARRIIEGDKLVHAGVFPGPHSMYLLGSQVHGKKIGIVGMGKIGRAISKRARAFDMTIYYYSTRRHPDVEQEFKAAYLSFEDLLKTVDFLCMLPKYSPETYHMIGEKQLEMMKPTAFLINTSRGPVVELKALVNALVMKRIAGAALDVLEGEPHPVLPQVLLDMPNVVMTPHIGSAVAEKREFMSNDIVDEVIGFIQGRRPSLIFNPEVLGVENNVKD
jgi:lactate dehydrogenase-like 2-hydroxyacid dehydrogenase